MKRFILLLLLTAFLAAQSQPEVDITAEPHHHQVFANDQVRVFNVDIPPHSETLLHRHGHDYFYVMFGASEIVNAVQGKDPVNVGLRDAQVGFTPGAFAHVVRNLDHPFRNVTVELLQDDKVRHAPAHWDPAHPEEDRGLEILHGGTKEILFVKDGVRASEIELQPGGIVPEQHRSGPYLLVAVTAMDLTTHAPLKSAMPVPLSSHFKPGDVQWLPQGLTPPLTNTGHTPARFVTLEFP
jgi:hypothetical protein